MAGLGPKIRRMLLEEWRMHAELFEGRNLAGTPILVFLMTFGGVKLVQNFSETSVFGIGLMISVFGFFSGLASATTGFSSRDASRNVLKNRTFLLYSSRTLPTPKRALLSAFFLKNIVFYLGLYLLPVALGAVAVDISLLIYVFYTLGLFIAGQLSGILMARSALDIRVRKFLNYYNTLGTPLTKKFFLDIYRSSGGLLKLFTTTGALLGLYWYAANYVPLAEYLLTRPMLSFSIILGLSSITIYNWLNTYDSVEEYTFLSIDEDDVLGEKFRAFKYISLAAVALFVPLFHMVEGGNLLLGLTLGGSVAYYTGSVSFYFAGLHPNEKMVNTWKILAFMIALNSFVIPLLGYSALETGTEIFYRASALMTVLGLGFEKLKKR
jgi:hypothetical protein